METSSQFTTRFLYCIVLFSICLAALVTQTESFPRHSDVLRSSRKYVDEDEDLHFRIARSRPEETSDEDSDEDDDEGDAEQAYQAALQQQAQQEAELSREDSGENGSYEDDVYRRRRREVDSNDKDTTVMKESEKPIVDSMKESKPEPESKPEEVPENVEESNKEEISTESNQEATTDKVSEGDTSEVSPSPAGPPSPETSVLISIREALKKVIAEISTQQVAASALEYFQAFEHFIQKTIEQVIDDDDEEDSQTINFTTALPETSTDLIEDMKEPEAIMPESEDKTTDASQSPAASGMKTQDNTESMATVMTEPKGTDKMDPMKMENMEMMGNDKMIPIEKSKSDSQPEYIPVSIQQISSIV